MPKWIIMGIGVFSLQVFGPTGSACGQQSSATNDQRLTQGTVAVAESAPHQHVAMRDEIAQGDWEYAEQREECGQPDPCTYGEGYGYGRGYLCEDGTCTMHPRYPYFPPLHGYYYFRPYHFLHVIEHQFAVDDWGGDPRNPYANTIFQRVYAEYRADRAKSPQR